MYGLPQAGIQAAASFTPNTSGQYTSAAPPAPRVAGPTSAARKPKPKPKPKNKGKGKGKGKGGGVPGINQYLAGDTTYQDQSSQLMKQLEQFQNSNQSQQDIVGQDFGTALDKMQKQKVQDQSNMTGDYAARGLLNSGLFTKSMGDYDTQYQSQMNDLSTSRQRSLADLLESLSNYQSENSSSLASAKQDAIRRRAQKYGITA